MWGEHLVQGASLAQADHGHLELLGRLADLSNSGALALLEPKLLKVNYVELITIGNDHELVSNLEHLRLACHLNVRRTFRRRGGG